MSKWNELNNEDGTKNYPITQRDLIVDIEKYGLSTARLVMVEDKKTKETSYQWWHTDLHKLIGRIEKPVLKWRYLLEEGE